MYNYRTTSLYQGGKFFLENFNIDSSDFNVRVNQAAAKYHVGIIRALYVINNAVFALVSPFKELNESGGHTPLYFNAIIGVSMSHFSIAELVIKTNINPANENVFNLVGEKCRVTVVKDRAIYAQVDYGAQTMTEIPHTVFRNIREALGDSDLFSQKGKDLLLNYGYTEEQVKELKELQFTEDHLQKVVTFEGEGVWQKDSTVLRQDEATMKPVNIISGLNNLGMKTKNCHIPSRIFSGR